MSVARQAAAGRVEVRLFGSPRVIRDGSALAFDTRKALALLALLAVTGAEHRRESLAALLWPDLDSTRGRAALRRTLSVAAAVGPALRVTASAVGLDARAATVDVTRFRELVADDDPASWSAAADLAEDDFLAGFSLRDSPAFDDWQLATADALRDELSQTLARLVADAVARGDLPGALAFARRRTRIGGVSEPAHADLIRVLAWSGDRPGALRAYRALVRLLDAELGVPPLPETLALHDAIRAGRLASQPGTPSVEQPRSGVSTPSGMRGSRDGRSASSSAGSSAASSTGGGGGLVGRGPELARLDAAWASAVDGGRVVGLVGETGIGKSALVRELASRVRAEGGTVVGLAGHAAEQRLAFAAAGDLARAVLVARPDLAAALGRSVAPLGAFVDGIDAGGEQAVRTPGDVQRIHEAFRVLVAAASAAHPLLLVVDDAQRIDGPSAGLLGYVVRRAPRGLLVVATWGRGAGDAPLPAAVTAAGEVIAVGPLDLPAVAALTGTDEGRAAEVLRRTRGIPLLVREAAQPDAPAEGTPDDARALVRARLGAAPALTRQLVGAASVIGTVADPELLRLACGRDEAETVDAIEDAVERGLLVERRDREGYDVPHELLRDLSLDELSLARTRLVHGRVADLLARRHLVDPLGVPAGAVGRHLAGAGRDDEAGAWFLAAARESIRLAAHAEALDQLDAALARGHAPLDVHEARGAVLVRLGRYAEALVAFDQAAALAESDAARLGAIEHAVAGLQDRLGDFGLALDHLEAARDLLADDPVRGRRVLADLALVLHRLGRDEAAREAALEATADGASADRTALAQATNVLGVIEQAAGDEAALPRFRDAVALARDVQDADLEIAALNNLSHAAAAAGDSATAMESARAALEGAERQGDLHRLAALHSHLADLLHASGQEDEALAELRSSASAFSAVQGATLRPEVWTLSEW